MAKSQSQASSPRGKRAKSPAAGGTVLPPAIEDIFLRRVWNLNGGPVRASGDYVLYWMISARRTRFNFALDRAVEWAAHFKRPLVVLEALRISYPWASDRLHRFIIDGMADNQRAFRGTPVLYYPYVEPAESAGRGLLEALADRACVVITDDFPAFFIPAMLQSAAKKLSVRLEAVDSNGLLPMRLAEKAFPAAVHFRRFVQKNLLEYLLRTPRARALHTAKIPRARALPPEILRRWPPASASLLAGSAKELARLSIDHEVPPAPVRGGQEAARAALSRFAGHKLDRYHELHNPPEADGTSRLSPYLHFGHISTHEIFRAVMRREKWSMGMIGARPTGRREGWWHVRPGAEAFLDQLITWRELGFNQCALKPRTYASFSSLPDWALETLARHQRDPRPYIYSRSQLEQAETHDPVWNAAQNQLRREGWFHNYMRMLWGKKILEWSRTPRQALAHMIALMDRWSLDGRDPNSYTGYFWVLGRYDRPWPERPVYGKVRAMTSESAARKFRLQAYLERYA